MKSDELDLLGTYTASQLRAGLPEGLRIYAETAWGWSELKASAFVDQIEKNGSTVTGYAELRRGSRMTLKVPRRV